MDMKRLVMMVVTGAAMAAAAMPTKQELQKAQAMVNDVTAADVAALKTKAKTPAEVAAKHMELATQAGSEAEKYLLLQGAFKLYAKAGDYEGAANALGTMNREIADMKPEVIVEIYNKAIFSSMKEKAPKLHAIKEAARRQVFYRKQLAKAEAAVKANPKDAAAQKKLGECHAELGDWPKALDAFALVGGPLAKTAKAELDGTAAPQVSGDFWWDYESGDEMSTYKFHAAELYRTALADDSFKGLARTRADQRVKEAEKVAVVARRHEVSPRTSAANGLYCVIDLSGGPDAKKYPVSYLNDMPKGGWSDEYKTTKLVLRRIEPGAFMMGEKGKDRHVAIKEPFYMGVFEVTQKQWSLIIGDRPSFWKGPQWSLRPVEQVTFERIRGKDLGSKWPESDEVDEYSFMWLLRQKTGLRFDLPREAQWEYVCRAGTDTDYYTGEQCKEYWHDSSADKIGRYMRNGGWDEEKWGKFDWGKAWSAPDRDCTSEHGTASVGTYVPNNWGFYDMSGNVAEMCLDRFDDEKKPNKVFRAARGGRWFSAAAELQPFVKERYGCGGGGWFGHGLRLCLPLAGGAAVQTPAAASAPTAKVGKAWQEKGNEATLDLGGKYGKLEFVKCPAGRVDMVVSSDGETCKVSISRPFWIMKRPVTVQQLQYNPKYKPGNGLYPCKHRELFEQFMELVSKNYGSSLPKNSVLRLPTLAEWEYAFHANTRNHKDPYYDLTKNHHDDDVAKQIYDVKDCINPKTVNSWGLSDFGWEKVLDKFTFDELKAVNSGFDREKASCANRLPVLADKKDPLFWTEDEANQVFVSRMPDWVLWRCRLASGKNWWTHAWTHARLVIGPDLVSEWKTTRGKK